MISTGQNRDWHRNGAHLTISAKRKCVRKWNFQRFFFGDNRIYWPCPGRMSSAFAAAGLTWPWLTQTHTSTGLVNPQRAQWRPSLQLTGLLSSLLFVTPRRSSLRRNYSKTYCRNISYRIGFYAWQWGEICSCASKDLLYINFCQDLVSSNFNHGFLFCFILFFVSLLWLRLPFQGWGDR